MTRTSSKPSVVRRAVRAPLRSSRAFVATGDPWITSLKEDDSRRPNPCMMASSGWRGVESSLKISILPSLMTTKSVNVPPVSTPTLKIDPRDILNMLGRNRFEALYCALRVAFPGQGLKVGESAVEVVNGDLTSPREVCVGQGRLGYSLDPVHDVRALFIRNMYL